MASPAGRGVFDGNVRVGRLAQKTDAQQLSRNLLLVPRATVNVKPNLQAGGGKGSGVPVPSTHGHPLPPTPFLTHLVAPSRSPHLVRPTHARHHPLTGSALHAASPLPPTPHLAPPPRPQIIADDVKCTHGCTVSDLEEEELFYLRWVAVASGPEVAGVGAREEEVFCLRWVPPN